LIILFKIFSFTAKGYLEKREEDPEAVILLGDSAYHRSKHKEELGFGLPVPQRKDGVQQKVLDFSVGIASAHIMSS
jgi:hypothetical protein